jgi:SPP1 family predicted phage head-tail adaptor
MALWMRQTVDSTLGPARAYVQTRTEVRTPTGGTTYAYTDGDFSYCNVAPMSAEELEHAGAMGVQAAFSCRVSLDMDVDPDMRIRIVDTGLDELDGVWSVKAVLTGHPSVDRLLYLARFG